MIIFCHYTDVMDSCGAGSNAVSHSRLCGGKFNTQNGLKFDQASVCGKLIFLLSERSSEVVVFS